MKAMKTRIPILILIMLLSGSVYCDEAKAQKPEELLIKANELYNESAYDSALVVYESIVNNGYSSSALYYNMGNTYYKLRNYPLAILYYEKSLKLDQNNEDTKHNIEIAQAFLSDKIEPVPELFIKTWWNKLGNMFTINTWALLSLIVIALFLIFLFLYLTARTRVLKKTSFFSAIILMVLVICTLSISSKKYKYISSQGEGIIMVPTITVKSSPSSSSVDLFVLHEGAKVVILDNTADWEKIKIANGSIGWLPASAIIKY